MKYLFLDTNILLHYKCFEDIPWETLLNSKDDISIVICETVVEEVDKHKDGRKGKLRDRAKKMSKRIYGYLVENEQGKYPVTYCTYSAPSGGDVSRYDTTVCDNRIILSAIHSCFDKNDIFIISADNNLIIKAKMAGLNYYKMGDDHRLKAEPTEEEIELKKNREELERLKNRQPSTTVLFSANQESEIIFEREKHREINEAVEIAVKQEESKYPIKGNMGLPNNEVKTFFGNVLPIQDDNPFTKCDVDFYNKMRNDYIDAYREYIRLETTKMLRDSSFKPLKFEILNNGTAPSGNLHIELIFPKSVKIYTEYESKSTIECDRLVKPQNNKTIAAIIDSHEKSIFRNGTKQKIKMWDVNKYVEEKRYTADVQSLTHGLKLDLDFDIYINTDELQEFEIYWLIADSALVDHSAGVLKVIVKEPIEFSNISN